VHVDGDRLGPHGAAAGYQLKVLHHLRESGKTTCLEDKTPASA
jgi:hypothetical protein